MARTVHDADSGDRRLRSRDRRLGTAARLALTVVVATVPASAQDAVRARFFADRNEFVRLRGEEENAKAHETLLACYEAMTDHYRPSVSQMLIYSSRSVGDMAGAWEHLRRAEEGLPAASQNALLLPRILLSLDAGLLDAARQASDAREAVQAGKPDVSELQIAMAQERWTEVLEIGRLLAGATESPDAEYAVAALRAGRDPKQLDQKLRDLPIPPSDLAQNTRLLTRAELALADGNVQLASELSVPLNQHYAKPTERFPNGKRHAIVRARLALLQNAGPAELRVVEGLLSSVWADQLSRWDQVPPSPGGVAFLQLAQRRGTLAMLMACRMRLDADNGVSHALEAFLRSDSRDSLARRMAKGRPKPKVADLQALAPRDGGILLYVPSPVGSHVFAVEQGRVTHFALPADSDLRATVNPLKSSVRRAWRRPNLDAIRSAGQKVLPHVLPADLKAHIQNWRSIAILGHGLMQGVPFEFLPDGKSVLGATRAIGYLPGVSVALELKRRGGPKLAGRGAFVVDQLQPDIQKAGRLAPLRIPPAAIPEAWSDAISGKGATLAALVKRKPSLTLDVVAHGASRSMVKNAAWDRPRGLTMFDQFVSCADIEGAALNNPCALLWVCRAGAAAQRRGDSAGHHLGGAFLQAGARVVGLADVDLELGDSLALSDAFHQELEGAGFRPAEAMRRARARILRAGKIPAPLRLEGLVHEPLR